MSKPHETDDDLYDVLDLADVLDVRASEVRQRLKTDPASLPLPLVFSGTGLVRWPRQQVLAWCKARCPRDYPHAATEFVPSWLAKFHNPAALIFDDPQNPVSDPRGRREFLDGVTVTYPETEN